MIRVPVYIDDVELFGTDPYRSARSWHDEWMKSEAEVARLKTEREEWMGGALERIAQLERIRQAADRLAGNLTLGDYFDNGAEADEVGLLDLEAELGVLAEEPVKL